MSNGTQIVASYPFMGCSNGVQVKTLPMSPYIINPCFYFRQNGFLSSTTVKPAFPLVPGTWNVTSYYTSAAGCTDITKQARPLYCSALLSTDPSVVCEPQACSVRSFAPRHTTLRPVPLFIIVSPLSPACVHVFFRCRWCRTRRQIPSACR